jgi:chromosomal replication initiation ATPase DnaA
MIEDKLYQEISRHVREMNNLLKAHTREKAPRVRQRRDYSQTGTTNIPLLERCADAFNVSTGEIISSSRRQNLAIARHLYFYIRYHHHNMPPSEQLGKELGRHRTTVMHSIKKARDLLSVDKNFRKKYEKIISIQ